MQNFRMNSKFYGDLDIHMSLSDIFETLGSKKRNGWLFIANETQEVCFYFNGNNLGLIAIPEVEISFIPEKLYYSGKISIEVYEKVKKYRNSLHFLEKYIEKQEIVKILDTIAFDEICKFFRWKKGYFYFVEEGNMEDSAKKYPSSNLFDARDLLMEAARRWDEWGEIEKKMPHHEEIFQHNIIPQKTQPKDEPLGNIWHIAQGHTLEEIIHFSYFSSFTAYKILCSLLSSKQLRTMTEEELLQQAKEKEAKGDYSQSIICYRILYKRNQGNTALYEFLAEAYRKENRIPELLAFYNEIVSYLFSKNLPEYKAQAAMHLKKWTENLPAQSEQSLKNRLLLLDMTLRKEIDSSFLLVSPIAEGLELIKIARENKQEELALDILKKLILYSPDNISLRENFIKILQEKKDNDGIVEQYESIARIYEKQNKLDKTEEFYKKILQAMPSRIDLLPKIRSVSVRKMNRIAQKKKLLYAAICILCIFLIIILYNNYQKNVKIQLDSHKEEIEIAIQRGDLDKASNLLLSLEKKEKEEIERKIKAKYEEAEQQINLILENAERIQEQGDLRSALQILSLSLQSTKIEKFRQKILLKKENFEEIINHFDQSLQKARSLETQGELENALQVYLEIWRNFHFKKIKERNLIKLPIKLYLTPYEVNISIDNGKPFLYKSGTILHCSPGFQKMHFSISGYHNAVMYNAFFSLPDSLTGQEKNAYFIQSVTKEIALSKNILWSFTPGSPIEGELCYGEEMLFFASKDSYIYAFENLRTQTSLKWKKKIASLVSLSSTPCYYEKILYIKGSDGYFYGLSAEREETVLGQFPMEKPVMSNSSAIVSDTYDSVLFASNTKLFALPLLKKYTKDWQPKWSFSFSNPIKASPSIAQDKVLIGSTDGFLYCLKMDSGTLLWKYRIGFPIISSATIKENIAYIGVYGTLYAFDIMNGAIVWQKEIGGIIEGSVAIEEDILFVGTHERNLHAFSIKGQNLWEFKATGILKTTPCTTQTSILFCCEQGWLYVLEIKTGRMIWKYCIADEHLSSPMIIGNKIFIGGKKLYSFLDN